jgi:mevalonate kinase
VKVNTYSNVPYGIGLGSSAASCVATIAAVESLFGRPTKNKICKQAIEAEQIIHTNSSGADCYVSTFGGPILFSKSEGYSRIKSKNTLSIVIINTGIRHSTGDLVARVKRFKQTNELVFADLARQAKDICSQAVAAICSGNYNRIGLLMNDNQKILQQIGVSHEKVDRIIDICMRMGSLGAKITGAGGGGAVIALTANKQDSEKIASYMRSQGQNSFEVEMDHKGLVVN